MQRAVKKRSQGIDQSGAQSKIAKQHKWKENWHDAVVPEEKTVSCTFKRGKREGKKVKEKSKEAENEGKFTAHGASGFEMNVCSKYMRRRAENMCILVTVQSQADFHAKV